jgi:hypothetical protein
MELRKTDNAHLVELAEGWWTASVR